MPTPTLYKYVQSELYKRGFTNEIVDEDDNLVFFDADNQTLTKMMQFDDDVKDIVDHIFAGQSLDDNEHDQHFKRAFLMRFINRKINRQTIESFKFELISTFMSNQSFINRMYVDIEKYLHQESINESTNQNTTKQINQQINEQISQQLDERIHSEVSESNNEEESNTKNDQTVTGDITTDNREAHAELPQSTVNLDVDDSNMTTADSNTISKNKQMNSQDTDGETTTFSSGGNTTESSGESSGEIQNTSNSQTDGTTDGEYEGQSNSISKGYRIDELFKTSGMLERVLNDFDRKCFMQIW